jgi:hypothetical protein
MAGFAAPRFGKDGTEMRFAVNYLALFLLTRNSKEKTGLFVKMTALAQ